jgi:hypothetical protein
MYIALSSADQRCQVVVVNVPACVCRDHLHIAGS